MPRKLLKFLILFDNPTLLYFPGQFVSGRVLVELEDETAVQGMRAPAAQCWFTSVLMRCGEEGSGGRGSQGDDW